MNELEIQFTSQTLSQAVALSSSNPHGIVDISPHTIRWMKSAVVSLCKSTGDMEITAVTPQQVWQWRENEMYKHVGEITLNSYLRALKTMYSRLQKNGITGHNPARPIKPLPEPQPDPKAITELNYLYLRDAACSVRNVAILDTLWSTGCRAGELISMDIDKLEHWMNNGRCSSARVIGKGRQQRRVYWSGVQATSLQQWLAIRPSSHSPAVFLTNRGKNFTDDGFSALTRRIRIRAGLLNQHTNPHAFRHAFAIRKLNDGYDLATVSQWLGHSSPEFTAKIYCVRTETELKSRFFSRP